MRSTGEYLGDKWLEILFVCLISFYARTGVGSGEEGREGSQSFW